MRIGHAEKDAVLEVLGKAYADGQLELEELEQRQTTCLAAKYADELPALTSDLSALPVARPETQEAKGAPLRFAVMGGTDLLLGPELPTVRSFALWGGNHIFIGDVMGPGVRLELSLISLMGGHGVFVPPGVRVIDESFSLMGGVDINRDARGDGSNGTLVIRGFNCMGGINVKLDTGRREPGAS